MMRAPTASCTACRVSRCGSVYGAHAKATLRPARSSLSARGLDQHRNIRERRQEGGYSSSPWLESLRRSRGAREEAVEPAHALAAVVEDGEARGVE